MLLKAFLIVGVPWIAFWAAMIFSCYAVARKRHKIDPILGLFIEILILLPITLKSYGWLVWSSLPLFFGGGLGFLLLAMFLGLLMVVPFILFHAGNKL